MNLHSSRSHLIFSILLKTTNHQTHTKTFGKVSSTSMSFFFFFSSQLLFPLLFLIIPQLSLVDLAGSERVSKSGATAEQLKEAKSINKSLSALGDVISALANKDPFIPYRNNKLTQLLSDSMGGNAKTLMFCNVSPVDFNAEETLTSLNYATRVKSVTNDASKNVAVVAAENKEKEKMRKILERVFNTKNLNLDEILNSLPHPEGK
jgi:hypothetical protein